MLVHFNSMAPLKKGSGK